jgi:hypothetical protein
VEHNFLLAVRFFKLCTVSYIISAACEFIGIGQNELDKECNEVSDLEKREMLEKVSKSILDLEWMDLYKITSQELLVESFIN